MRGPTAEIRLRAWVPIWRRPWMSISGHTYGSTLLGAAGIANVYDAAPDPYPSMTLPEVAVLRPDVVLAPSEPYPFNERHREELDASGAGRLRRRPGSLLVGKPHARRSGQAAAVGGRPCRPGKGTRPETFREEVLVCPDR